MNNDGASDSRTTAPIHGTDGAAIPDEWLAALSRGMARTPHGTSSAAASSAERKALEILARRLTSMFSV